MATPSIPPVSPSACAGLRRALLQEGPTAFPIEPSPFQTLVRRHGGSARELLLHCQALRAEGSVQGLRPRWRPGLARAALRLLAHGPGMPAQPPAGLLALPGAMTWAAVEAGPEGPGCAWQPPVGWVDLCAIDAAAVCHQADALANLTPSVSWSSWAHDLASTDADPDADSAAQCRCGQDDGPCRTRSLAAACERGLPVVAHPYRAVGLEVGLTERQVVQALRRWRARGLLEGVGLSEPVPTAAVLEWHAAYGPAALAAPLRDAIVGHATVERLVTASWTTATASTDLAALAQLVVPGGATAAQLAGQLARAGLGRGLLGVLKVRRITLRLEPLLFAEPAVADAGAS